MIGVKNILKAKVQNGLWNLDDDDGLSRIDVGYDITKAASPRD